MSLVGLLAGGGACAHCHAFPMVAGGTRGLMAHLSFGGLPREPCFVELGGDPLARAAMAARLERCPHSHTSDQCLF